YSYSALLYLRHLPPLHSFPTRRSSDLFASLFSAGQDTTALPLPDPGNVTLTLAEYNRLVELAANPPKKPELAPLPYSIQHASSGDRKSTRLNSSHQIISYAVFCLKKKN